MIENQVEDNKSKTIQNLPKTQKSTQGVKENSLDEVKLQINRLTISNQLETNNPTLTSTSSEKKQISSSSNTFSLITDEDPNLFVLPKNNSLPSQSDLRTKIDSQELDKEGHTIGEPLFVFNQNSDQNTNSNTQSISGPNSAPNDPNIWNAPFNYQSYNPQSLGYEIGFGSLPKFSQFDQYSSSESTSSHSLNENQFYTMYRGQEEKDQNQNQNQTQENDPRYSRYTEYFQTNNPWNESYQMNYPEKSGTNYQKWETGRREQGRTKRTSQTKGKRNTTFRTIDSQELFDENQDHTSQQNLNLLKNPLEISTDQPQNEQTIDKDQNSLIFEVEFKGGRKEIFFLIEGIAIQVGDFVIVEADRGTDLGRIVKPVLPNQIMSEYENSFLERKKDSSKSYSK